MGLGNIYKLSLMMQMVDKITAPVKVAKDSLEDFNKTAENVPKDITPVINTAAMLGLSKVMFDGVSSAVEATFDTQQAIGELASLGVKDLNAIDDAATKFTQRWAGTSKSEFISAAYDIKSGIASLSDVGVGEYTELAGLTAKATKSTTSEMTNLFATGYGIYKNFYSDMTDLEFGETFSAGIAKSVQQFKTDGSKMSQAIQTLGAAGTNALVPLEEQFAVLGMLQATMGGSEAGTKYKAFFKSAAKAGEAMGLTFTDANNQLLSMPDILTQIRGKYGEVMDATEKMELQKAFGTEEAVALIDLLYGKIDDLKDNTLDLQNAMGEGMQTTVDMADMINSNSGSYSKVLSQAVDNLKGSLGMTIAPMFDTAVISLTNFIIVINNLITKYPAIGQFVMILGLLLATVLGGIGVFVGLQAAMGKITGIFAIAGKGFMLLMGGAKALFAVFSALAFNPLTWIVLGIVAAAAAVYYFITNMDLVKEKLSNLGDVGGQALSAFGSYIASKFVEFGAQFLGFGMFLIMQLATGVLQSMGIPAETIMKGIETIKTFISGTPEWFRNSGLKIMTTFADGIKAGIMAPVNAVKNGLQTIRNMLPFSDAKTGPLSTLTLSGTRTMTTIGEGIKLAEDEPAKAVRQGFKKISLSSDKDTIKKVSLGKAASTTDSQLGTKELRIGNLVINVKLEDIEDIKKLKKLLLELEDLDFGNGEVLPA